MVSMLPVYSYSKEFRVRRRVHALVENNEYSTMESCVTQPQEDDAFNTFFSVKLVLGSMTLVPFL